MTTNILHIYTTTHQDPRGHPAEPTLSIACISRIMIRGVQTALLSVVQLELNRNKRIALFSTIRDVETSKLRLLLLLLPSSFASLNLPLFTRSLLLCARASEYGVREGCELATRFRGR